jgi:putative hydrolase of the HAD superfamily
VTARRQLHGPPVRAKRARVHGQQAVSQQGQRHHTSRADPAPVWFFDLDNTLHDTSFKIFKAINIGMTAAVMESLNVDEPTAHSLRTKYWRRYGATMIGMVKHHGMNAQSFLHRSHSFDVKPLIRAETNLASKLNRLPGRKVLVTNAPLHYARAVLKHLRMLRCFDSLWGVEEMRVHGHYRPKPSISIMRYILAHEGVSPRRAILVEDTLENLRGARAAGMRTVHVFHPGTPFAHGKNGRPDFVDLRVKSVGHLLLQRRPVRGKSQPRFDSP